MRSGRMRNGESRSAARLGARTVAGRAGGVSPGEAFARGDAVGRDRGTQRAPSRRAPRGTCALQATACGLPIRPVLKHGPRSPTCVRVDGRGNPVGARKLTGGIPDPRRRGAPPADPDLLRRVRVEHGRRDPKDGELCLSGAKPEETLVEARSDTDVQIVRLTWV